MKIPGQSMKGAKGAAARAAETVAREAELAALPTTGAGWAAKGAELRAELAEIEGEMAALPAQRRALALSAHAGNEEAQVELSRLNARQGELAGLVDRLGLAIEAASDAEGEARAAERVEVEAQRRAAASEAAQVVLTEAEALDEAAKALAARQASYSVAVDALARLAPEKGGILGRRKELHLVGAMADAGILRPAGLPNPSRTTVLPLGEAVAAVLAEVIGEAPTRTPATGQEIAA